MPLVDLRHGATHDSALEEILEDGMCELARSSAEHRNAHVVESNTRWVLLLCGASYVPTNTEPFFKLHEELFLVSP